MDDLISRQAAIDAFLTELTKRERKNLLHTWSTVEVKYFVVDMLEKLPSAQPERKPVHPAGIKSKQLIDELAQMPPMVIATAYLHAINYALYGEDVTEKWLTATQNASALEKAYKKGYYDALQRQAESEK